MILITYVLSETSPYLRAQVKVKMDTHISLIVLIKFNLFLIWNWLNSSICIIRKSNVCIILNKAGAVTLAEVIIYLYQISFHNSEFNMSLYAMYK